MKILGFSLSKISSEKFPKNVEKVNVSTSLNIKELKQTKTDLLKTRDDFIGISFSYTIDYNPDFAKLEFSGNMLVSVEPKLAKEVLKDWKDKKLNEEFRIFLFNMILKKTTVKALELEDELNLPYHLPLPEVRKESFAPKNSKEGSQ